MVLKKGKILIIAIAVAILMSSVSCAESNKNVTADTPDKNTALSDIYVLREEKETWYSAIVKLISNQDVPYGNPEEGIIGYKPPRANEPSIAAGYSMGLFDVDIDGVPELLLDLGGGSSGNNFFNIYDIFSGKLIGNMSGGGQNVWAMYYDIENDCYMPVGRYDLRSGDSGSMHYIDTLAYDAETQMYYGKTLFYSAYEYDKKYDLTEDGKMTNVELVIEDVEFKSELSVGEYSGYHNDVTAFYQTHSLVPYTGLKLYRWDDVSEDDESDKVRAEKMAAMLLYGSGQEFVKISK